MATVEVDVDVLTQLLCDHRDISMMATGIFRFEDLIPRDGQRATVEQARDLRKAILHARRHDLRPA